MSPLGWFWRFKWRLIFHHYVIEWKQTSWRGI